MFTTKLLLFIIFLFATSLSPLYSAESEDENPKVLNRTFSAPPRKSSRATSPLKLRRIWSKDDSDTLQKKRPSKKEGHSPLSKLLTKNTPPKEKIKTTINPLRQWDFKSEGLTPEQAFYKINHWEEIISKLEQATREVN